MKTHRFVKTFGYILTHPKDVYRLVYSSKIEYPSLYKRLTDDVSKEKSLDMIGKIQSTDKASAMIKESHFDKMHDYLRHYETFFRDIRYSNIKLLEFGCQGGNSLRMWESYFSKGQIYGVDLNEKCKSFETERTTVVVGNAVGEDTFKELSKQGGFDIIIDDASHAWGEQRYCLEKYWNLLKSGGYYIVEDLECGCYGEYYNKGYVPEIVDREPFFEYAQKLTGILRWVTLEQANNKYNWQEYPDEFRNIQESLDSVVYAPCIIIFRKKQDL